MIRSVVADRPAMKVSNTVSNTRNITEIKKRTMDFAPRLRFIQVLLSINSGVSRQV
jgi:hypothetical protein